MGMIRLTLIALLFLACAGQQYCIRVLLADVRELDGEAQALEAIERTQDQQAGKMLEASTMMERACGARVVAGRP
jgi:hypothetical protein